MTKGKGKNPGASNLGKHLKRTSHKERSQPKSRARLGQLEKHKDHVLRARRRKEKVKRLQKVKRSAAQRNPDEFNLGMTKAVMDIATGRMKRRKVSAGRGEKAKEKKKEIENNQKTIQYLNYKAQSDMNRVKDILEEDASIVITSSSKPSNKHTVFVENEEELQKFKAHKYFDTTTEMLKQHPSLRAKISVMKETVLPDELILSGGHYMLSSSQKRKERRKIQEKLRRSGLTDQSERDELVKKWKIKKEKKHYSLEDLAAESSASAENANKGEEDDEADEVSRILKMREEKEKNESKESAKKVKEITQRTQRSRNLKALAKNVVKQNEGIKKQLSQKRESRFKKDVPRRSR